MNQTFNMNRWMLLIKMHWSENKKKYFLSLAAIAGLLFIWYGLLLLVMAGRDTLTEKPQVMTYYTGLFITGCLYASVVFADLSNRPKAINYLMLPASAFEKVLTALLFAVVLYFISFTIIYYLVDISMVKLSNSLYVQFQEKHGNPVRALASVANVFVEPSSPQNSYYMVMMLYILVQSLFILGSVYFPKYSFILTTISLALLIVFLVFLVSKVFLGILPEGNYDDAFSTFLLRSEGSDAKMLQLPHWTGWLTMFVFRYLLAPVLWVVTYFRLKEKQI